MRPLTQTIYLKLLPKFNPSKDEFCENIEYPKNNQVYLHYSTDDKKVDDWKADGMLWENNGQKLRGSKKNPIYRVLYHFKLGVNNKPTNLLKTRLEYQCQHQ